MIIGIDARFYAEAGGIGRYIKELIKELEKQDTCNFYVVFVNRDGYKEYEPANPNFKKVLTNVPWYTLKEQLKMGGIIKRQKIDLMHFPHWNIPLFYRRPFIITIHDLILLKFHSRRSSTRGALTYWIKNLGYKLILRHVILASKKILVPSQFVKKDILENFKIPEDKIKMIYEGVTRLPQLSAEKNILKKFKIDKPYFLYVGVAYPHKNLENLLLAFKKFREIYSSNYQLVLAGKKNYFYKRLEKFAAPNNIGGVIFTDFVKDEELPALYQNATAYVFPSLYEGFGLPPLEAMAHNLPVVSSNSSCLPEILNEAALYFNPKDINSIASALNNVAIDANLRQKLILAGQNRIKLFSWKNCAQLALREYLK